MKFKAILWDNDGLLVDSERIYYEANRQALLRAGVTLTLAQFADISLRQGLSLLDLARQKGWTSAQLGDLRKERDSIYLYLLEQGVPLLPSVKKTLEILKAKGIRMAVVTSSQRVHFDAIHKKSDLLPYFEFVLTREDYAEGKPAPDGYLKGIQKLGLDAKDCLAVEDSERGFLAAHAAGLSCIVVPNAHTKTGRFDGALAVCESVDQILPYL